MYNNPFNLPLQISPKNGRPIRTPRAHNFPGCPFSEFATSREPTDAYQSCNEPEADLPNCEEVHRQSHLNSHSPCESHSNSHSPAASISISPSQLGSASLSASASASASASCARSKAVPRRPERDPTSSERSRTGDTHIDYEAKVMSALPLREGPQRSRLSSLSFGSKHDSFGEAQCPDSKEAPDALNPGLKKPHWKEKLLQNIITSPKAKQFVQEQPSKSKVAPNCSEKRKSKQGVPKLQMELGQVTTPVFSARKESLVDMPPQELAALHARKAELFGTFANRYELSPRTLNKFFEVASLEKQYLKKIKRKADEVTKAKHSMLLQDQACSQRYTVEHIQSSRIKSPCLCHDEVDNGAQEPMALFAQTLMQSVARTRILNDLNVAELQEEIAKLRSKATRSKPLAVSPTAGQSQTEPYAEVAARLCEVFRSTVRRVSSESKQLPKRERELERQVREMRQRESEISARDKELAQKLAEVTQEMAQCETLQTQLRQEQRMLQEREQELQTAFSAEERKLRADRDKIAVLEADLTRQQLQRTQKPPRQFACRVAHRAEEQPSGRSRQVHVCHSTKRARDTQSHLNFYSPRNKENVSPSGPTHKFS